jgi:hypothetical protein
MEPTCGLNKRVMEPKEWLERHRPHSEIAVKMNERQPPKGSYLLYTLVCECGQKLVTLAYGCIDCDIAPDGICEGHRNG